ncbi:unnamed protein product [Gongylonema pulchrum]|uniref:NOT2_3_5 domain-containing protein n=1 Tax=Gongylonema pulchrum TaxID=637853 RepID=A0A183DU15_9BILA|nr:unnamed protein product [Gongylonema pulchrum]
MLNSQYGMAALLSGLREMERNPNTGATLAAGHDVATLGVNFNATGRNIHPTFGGPWQSCSCPAQDSEARVPKEYRVLSLIGHRLPPFSLRTLSEDTLFYFFYNFPGEEYQIGAANELYYRDWRYHKSLHVWMMRSQRGYVKEHGPTFEKGTYLVFDHTHWRKVSFSLGTFFP